MKTVDYLKRNKQKRGFDKILSEFFARFFLSVASTIGVLGAFGLIMEKLEGLIMTKIFVSQGYVGVAATSLIGTPVHEFSHWLMCKLFRFKVVDVELLRLKEFRYDGVLGYVSFEPAGESSLFQTIGTFFIGVAPLLLGSLFIMLIVRILIPEGFKSAGCGLKSTAKTPQHSYFFRCLWNSFLGFWKGLFSRKGVLKIVSNVVGLYMVMSISMHMTLSMQDIKTGMKGFVALLGVYFIVNMWAMFFRTKYVENASRVMALFGMFMSIGLVSDIVVLILVYIL